MQQTPAQTLTAGEAPGAADPRIQSMFSQDRLWALGLLIVLWLLYAFVFYEVWPNTGNDNVSLALAISGGLVLLFNSASIIAMIKHYADDKQRIYGLDLHYQDIMNKAKR
jgi:hypothetical protein